MVACYGAMETWDLQPGQRMVIDTGHLVAYTEGTAYVTRQVNRGLAQSLKSGEGLVFEFTGPGRVVSQTRSPTALTEWLTTVLPFTRAVVALRRRSPSIMGVADAHHRPPSCTHPSLAADELGRRLRRPRRQLGRLGPLVGFIAALLLVDLLVFHRKAHDITFKEAAIETAVWISIGLLFGLVILWAVRGPGRRRVLSPAT